MLTLNDIAHLISPLLMNPNLRTYESENDTFNHDTLSRAAAILVIIHCKHGTPHTLLTRRSSHLRFHTGEISLGLCFSAADILGRLETVHTLTSNFTIVPFITLQTNIPEPKIFTNEVESIIDVPLQDTLATCQPDLDHYHISQKDVYKFTYQGIVIWGATARILKQLHNYLTP